MADTAPQGQERSKDVEEQMVASSSQERAAKFTAANMVRSLLPLTVIVLALVGLTALRQNDVDPVRTVETATGTQLAAARASYPLLVPQDLPDGWRATSITTDAGNATETGDPVTLSIGTSPRTRSTRASSSATSPAPRTSPGCSTAGPVTPRSRSTAGSGRRPPRPAARRPTCSTPTA